MRMGDSGSTRMLEAALNAPPAPRSGLPAVSPRAPVPPASAELAPPTIVATVAAAAISEPATDAPAIIAPSPRSPSTGGRTPARTEARDTATLLLLDLDEAEVDATAGDAWRDMPTAPRATVERVTPTPSRAAAALAEFNAALESMRATMQSWGRDDLEVTPPATLLADPHTGATPLHTALLCQDLTAAEVIDVWPATH